MITYMMVLGSNCWKLKEEYSVVFIFGSDNRFSITAFDFNPWKHRAFDISSHSDNREGKLSNWVLCGSLFSYISKLLYNVNIFRFKLKVSLGQQTTQPFSDGDL